jgi:hypothetical protein
MLYQQDSWRTAMQGVAAEIDATMGECVIVTPVDYANSEVNFPKQMLPGSAVIVTAVYTETPTHALGKPSRMKYGSGYEGAPLVTTRKPGFSFAFGAVPFALGQGCRIERRCSGEIFEITDVKSDGVSRIECNVVQLGRQRAK